MEFLFAPMEGVTDYSYRLAHSRFFPGVSRYYSPFIAANQTCSMKTREKEDVAPEHNSGVVLVPQILTNNADVFLWAVDQMACRGWKRVNLNLGCPSATVFTHGKGAGFLTDISRLDFFFERVFDGLASRDVEISVKTRIGVEDPEEAGELLRIFQRYPIAELIVHPRLRKDFYLGEPDLDTYQLFYEEYRGSLVYNGDIRTPSDLRALLRRFPDTKTVMIGRGLIANPALVRVLQGGEEIGNGELQAFHDEVLERRLAALQGFQNTEGKMKELWYYMGGLFPGSERELKRIKKAHSLEEYRAAAAKLFREGRISAGAVPRT